MTRFDGVGSWAIVNFKEKNTRRVKYGCSVKSIVALYCTMNNRGEG